MLNPAPKNVGGGSQNHLKSYIQVPKTVMREEAYKGGQKLQTYPKVLGFLKYIQKVLKFRWDVTIKHLLGKRLEVYWRDHVYQRDGSLQPFLPMSNTASSGLSTTTISTTKETSFPWETAHQEISPVEVWGRGWGVSSGTESHSKEGGIGSSTLLPQTGGGYRFHLNTSAPVTTHASLQQINKLLRRKSCVYV